MDKTLYQLLVDAGVPKNDLASHCSDLYVAVTPLTTPIVKDFFKKKGEPMPKTFIGQGEEVPRRHFDILFAYDPFWDPDNPDNHPSFFPYIPKSPFYELQEKMASNMHAFMAELEAVESDNLRVRLKDGSYVYAAVSVASFLCGFCGELAKYWLRAYGFPILAVMEGDALLHVFNYAIGPKGENVYLDARGATTSLEALLAPFQRENLILLTSGEDALKHVPDWAFPEDEYSEAMINWLLMRFPACYHFDTLKKPTEPFSVKGERR